MKFLILVISSIYFLIFSSIEIKGQTVKKVPDKSFVKEDELLEKTTSKLSTQDSVIIKSLDNNQLNEVIIKGQPPLLKYASNGTINVNVANTLLATSSSVNELLGRVPNVVVSEGQVSVLGKGEAIIYLNGILITYERFAAIPVSQIASIEVVANPSSKYDAEGKAVINLITKKNIENGIMGTMTQQITVSKFAGISTNTLFDFNYTKGKFSFISNYGLQLGKGRELLFTTRTRPNPDEYMRSELTTDWKRQFNNYSNFGFGLQYTFSEKSYFSLAYSGNIEDLGGVVESRNSITDNINNSFYTTDIAKNDVLLNQFVNLNYNLITDKKGSSLFIAGQYSDFNGKVNDFIEENGIVNDLTSQKYLKNIVGSTTDIFTAQADFSKKISEKNKLDAGAKFSYAEINSGTDFLTSENRNSGFELNDELSSDFSYLEKIKALYFNFGRTFNEKLDVSVGVRSEWTHYNLATTARGNQQFEKSYSNFFPNLLLNFSISDNLKGHFSYVSRITRPRYQALNPYVIYQDPFTTIEGNPNLLPEKVHAFEIGAMYKKFDFKLGYTYKIDPIGGAALRGDTPNSYVLRSLNLEKQNDFFASASRSFNNKWWNSTNTVSVNLSKVTDDFYEYETGPVKPQIYLYSNNTFTIPNLCKIQLLAWYLGEKSYGLRSDNDRSVVTVGIERNFFKDALKLNFTANDIFNTFNVSGNYDVGQTEIYYHRTYTMNYFKLVATYSFGNSKKTTYKKTEIEQSENNRAR